MKNIDDKSVERLIIQYKEYSEISKYISELESKLLLDGGSTILGQITFLKRRLARLSDEMSFANHIVWMKYKREAYRNQSGEIVNMSDFKKHCSPDGYICTKRFAYLKSFLQRIGVDITDTEVYPDAMDLSEFFEKDEIKNLLENPDFMNGWQDMEYFVSDGKINKWGNFKVE